MIKMKSIYRKTGMIVAVLALLAVMSAPTAMAKDLPTITAHWDSAQKSIVATASDFGNQNGKYHQFKCSLEDTTLTGDIFIPGHGTTYTEKFELAGLENTEGVWTVCLYKGGSEKSKPDITSPRGCCTVTVGCVPIPEFATIAIPIVALLGLVAFYRRKQKK